MRKHLIIWSVTLAIVACAAAIVVSRQSLMSQAQNARDAETLVADALRRLADDAAAWQRDTQFAVRAAATEVERGVVRSAEGYFVLAVQYQREENVSGAEALYKRAIALRPDWSWPYAGLGALLGRHTFGRTEEAKTMLRKAIQLDPQWARPHNMLAVVLRLEGRLDEAEEEALAALRLDPDDIAAHNNYANLLVATGNFEDAETHYRQASELDPQHPKPYYNLACLYSLEGRKDEAIANLQEALKRATVLRADAATDPDLAPIRDLPEFRRLVYGEDHPTSPGLSDPLM